MLLKRVNKKGQFFLLASLIISTVLFSLGTTFIETNATKEDNNAQKILDRMSYEFTQTLDRGFYAGATQESLESDINSLASSYSSSYQNSEFSIIYGKDNFKSKLYKKGQGADFSSNITIEGNKIKASYLGNIYEFEKHSGYNLNVILKLENNNEKTIIFK